VLGLSPSALFAQGLRWIGFGIIGFLLLTVIDKALRHAVWERSELRVDKERTSEGLDLDPLVERARGWLHELRFQQSFSAGWSGSLKLPIGIEGSLNQATSIAQKQYTLPEIVKEYGELIKMISHVDSTRVIIAIDELDKIESSDAAQRFMNEIKALFGLPNCFYLVSVSENALSSFERRGLPLRDTFDSAFDTMIYVGYLDRERAFNLIRRRVVGMPIPFLAFCYAVSGGLPRDLIRVCRDIFEYEEVHGTSDLTPTCRSLIMHDLASKTRATISKVAAELGVGVSSWPIDKLRNLQEAIVSDQDVLSACYPLMSRPLTHREGEPIETAVQIRSFPQPVDTYVYDLAVYGYYVATLMQVLSSHGKSDAWQETTRCETLKVFDEFALARQDMGSSVTNAMDRITRLRSQLGLNDF
jgi:hypothetical protein